MIRKKLVGCLLVIYFLCIIINRSGCVVVDKKNITSHVMKIQQNGREVVHPKSLLNYNNAQQGELGWFWGIFYTK